MSGGICPGGECPDPSSPFRSRRRYGRGLDCRYKSRQTATAGAGRLNGSNWVGPDDGRRIIPIRRTSAPRFRDVRVRMRTKTVRRPVHLTDACVDPAQNNVMNSQWSPSRSRVTIWRFAVVHTRRRPLWDFSWSRTPTYRSHRQATTVHWSEEDRSSWISQEKNNYWRLSLLGCRWTLQNYTVSITPNYSVSINMILRQARMY